MGRVRSLLMCFGACLLGLATFLTAAGQGSSAGGASSPQPLATSLLAPSFALPHALGDEGEPLGRQEAAHRNSRLAAAARSGSDVRFEHLNAAQAGKLAREAFPAVIVNPAGGPPPLHSGQKLLGFISATIARVDLGGGKRGVVESDEPMAIETSAGRRTPIDLDLTGGAKAFQPVTPLVGVTIPRQLSAGVQLPALSLSLTPTDAQGVALGGSDGALDGDSVFYANTQPDTDTLVKPTTRGFDTNTILRSLNSPTALHFRVSVPAGVQLVQRHRNGAVEISAEGTVVAAILPPSAADAAGTPVPVSMTLKGATLTLAVASHSREYQWPISVDPSVTDSKTAGPEGHGHWEFKAEQESRFTHHWSGETLELGSPDSLSPGEYATVQYETQGASHIYELEAESAGLTLHGRAIMQFAYEGPTHEGKVENQVTVSENSGYGATRTKLCPNSGESECSTAAGNNTNLVRYKLIATEPITESYSLSAAFWNAHVYIEQEKAPEVSFNESATEIEVEPGVKRLNALHGEHDTGGKEPWMGPNSNTAFEIKAHDPGIGISWVQTSIYGWKVIDPLFEEHKCAGVQCNENFSEKFTYNPSMHDGEQTIELDARDLIGNFLLNGEEIGQLGTGIQLIKIDSTPPRNLEVTGWPANREISAAPHTLTVESTDGTAPEHSSGVKSISVAVDGGAETPLSVVPCTLGPCTTSGKWTLNAEALSEGTHSLVVTSTDNAGNIGSKEFTFDVRHANPVPVGPGSVDPTTGQFEMSVTDVSLPGAGGVARTFKSRGIATGVGGPLGPQWSISLGGGEGLTVLPNESVALTGSAGGRTTFPRNTSGEFESPLGDSNLKLEAKEKEVGKGITEYLLTDATAGTTTHFTQPSGTQSTTPTYTNQFGNDGAQLKTPESIASDAGGKLWVTDFQDGRIEKFASTGTLLASYGSFGSAAGEFTGPWGVAVNQSSGNVYVTDQANNRIDELSSTGTFIEAFGWGVKDGKAEFEICTSSCQAGLAGSGSGQVYVEAGIAVDSSGNVWVADYGNNRLDEFNEKGNFLKSVGTEGKGELQFKGPLNIASNGSDLYVTDYGNDRVEELTNAGAYVGSFGKEGTGNAEFKNPRGIAVDAKTGNLYVTDAGNNRMQELTSAGAFIAKFGSAGSSAGQLSEPTGVAFIATGGIYVADYNNGRVEEWSRPAWLPTLAEGALPSATTTYAYEATEVEEQTIVEPAEALAPPPAGVTCGTTPAELKKGCRALTFYYAKTTSAKGEAASEWGSYKGRLEKVYFHAWNPATGAMAEPVVAQYEYDAQGRLRAEWDPRITSAVRTEYGYDPEGHLTAVTPAGQQTWALTYGTIAGDPNTGRLIKAMRSPATTALWNGQPTANTFSVTISKPYLGVKAAINLGTWSNSPVTYGYQWEDCEVTEWHKCTPILGATNQNYTPTNSDLGQRLGAIVTATNGGGSTTAFAGSDIVVSAETKWWEVPDHQGVVGLTTGPDKNIWYAEREKTGTIAHIGKMTTAGVAEEYGLAPENQPTGEMTSGPDGNLWFTESNGKVAKITTAGKATYYTLPIFSEPGAIVAGSDGNLWFTEKGKVAKVTTAGKVTEYSLPSGSTPKGIAAGPDKNLWVSVGGTDKIDKITTAGVISAEYALEGAPGTIAEGPDENLWFSMGGKMCKITTSGTITCYASGGGGYVTSGPASSLWVTHAGGVARTTTTGEYTEYPFPKGDTVSHIAAGPDGNLWYTEVESDKIGRLNPIAGAGTSHNPEPGASIEYHLPLSGAGLPTMTEAEVAKWGQKDDPTEGMAVFPPDEPMGYPASDYKRATIEYLDSHGRTVNIATPTGGIATSEYNEANDAVRALTADNRVAALKEGSKSSEVAEKLDTKSTYSTNGSELLETLGPEHKVKLAGGSEVQAREHTKYFYNEGAPEGSHAQLLTKTTDGAQYSGKEEDVRTKTLSYAGPKNIGWTLGKPTAVTTDPAGLNLTSKTVYEESTGNVLEVQTPAASGKDASVAPAYVGQFGKLGSEAGQLKEPKALAVATSGHVFVLDTGNSRIEEFSGAGSYLATFGSAGTGNGNLKTPYAMAADSKGNLWVADTGNNRVQEFNSKNEYHAQFGKEGTAEGQFKEPKGIAVTAAGSVFVSDTANNRIEKFSEAGVFQEAFGWGVSNGEAKLQTCTSSCRAGLSGSGNGQLNAPRGIAVSSSGNVWVLDTGNSRVQEFSEAGAYVAQFGSHGSASGQFLEPTGVSIESSSGDLWVADAGADRLQEFTAAGVYLTTIGSKGTGNGQFEEPWGVAANAAGNLYVADTKNSRVSEWTPSITGSSGAHTLQTIYYSIGANATYPACGEHPEWANLACETKPAAQPGTAGLPELPVRTVTYNLWDEVEKMTETFGSVTRVTTQTYDSAGRALTSEVTSSVDTALPTVTNEYNKETGALVAQSTTSEGKTKTISMVFNTLGQMTSYTDADGATTHYAYDIDGRVEEASYSIGLRNFTQAYTYNSTTGLLTKLSDSIAGSFTASYDVEGKMLTEGYPNGMTATYTINSLGQDTGLEYLKATHCTESCTWFTDSETPSIHGETLAQTSTLAKDAYTYDQAGRLVQAQEEPSGKGCVTRIYAHDEEDNRVALTTREPGGEGKCATEGGSTEWHTYDTANRLTDPGVAYEAFGNITSVPAADAGGKALTSTYYVDSQIASQTQNEETIRYGYDPAGRTRERVSSGKTGSTVISHYAGPGEELLWTGEEGEAATRNIPGIDGALDAIEHNTAAPVLQLHDLQGNVIATAALSETETKLLTTYNSTEFGVPQPGTTPPPYAWLGATGLSTEPSLATGVSTQGGASYVPQLARNLQTGAVVPPGAFPNGTGTGSPYTSSISAWSIKLSEAETAGVIAEWAAKQKAAEEAACRANPVSCMLVLGDPPPKVTYLTLEEANTLAWNIRWWVREGDESAVVGFFFDLKGFAEEAIESIVSGDADKKWDEFLAGKLEYCVSELDFWGATGGGCRVSEPTIAIGELCIPTGPESEKCANILTLPDLSKDPEVSMCGRFVVVNGFRRLGECIYLGPGYG